MWECAQVVVEVVAASSFVHRQPNSTATSLPGLAELLAGPDSRPWLDYRPAGPWPLAAQGPLALRLGRAQGRPSAAPR